MMHRIDAKTVEPMRRIATLVPHPPTALSFKIKGHAMEPRFVEDDVVSLVPTEMAERGTLVLAHISGEFHFRRFLPRTEGKTEGAILRALNSDFPDIEMKKGDTLLGRLMEHVSNRST